jgi:glucokinase
MKKIFVVDIGGTNSRFAVFEAENDGCLHLKDSLWLSSLAVQSFDELLLELKSKNFPCSGSDFDALVIAIAGPVKNEAVCKATNLDWGVDTIVNKNYGFPTAIVINDFVAQAYACRTAAVENIKSVQDAEVDYSGAVGVVGAGTGLGHCALVPVSNGGYIAVPSEAGHASFAFEGKDEIDFGKFIRIKKNISYCYGDVVLTGTGLQLLHLFLTGEDLSPEEIGRKMTAGGETLEWYSRLYARSCRNYALSVMSTGGLFISGGIAAKNPYVCEHPEFLKEFRSAEKMYDFLSTIPVFLNDNQNSGVYGAAYRGYLRLCRGL